MKKIFKYFSVIFLFFLFLNPSYSKPLPPGSGEGDVPANILILLDSSESMNNEIGDGIPQISSSAIDGDGNIILVSADKNKGGIFKYNSDNERLNISGVSDDGASYEFKTWRFKSETTTTCDWRIGPGVKDANYSIDIDDETNRFLGLEYVTGVTVAGTNISGENLLFVGQFNKQNATIFGLNSNYQCVLAITGTAVVQLRSFDVGTTANGDKFISTVGRGGKNNTSYSDNSKHGFQLTCNLSSGDCKQVYAWGSGKKNTTAAKKLREGNRPRIDRGANYFYMSYAGNLYGYPLTTDDIPIIEKLNINETRRCLSSGKSADSSNVGKIVGYDVSTNNDDIFYIGGTDSSHVQKIQFDTNTSCSVLVHGGKRGTTGNDADPGDLAAADIQITDGIWDIKVQNQKILVANLSYLDEIDETKFTASLKDTAWQKQYAGAKETRWTGAKRAITSVLSDSTITSGANFGFGHWNAGEYKKKKNRKKTGPKYKDGAYCHKDGRNCKYYDGLNAKKTVGKKCNFNSCLAVPISSEGAAKTIAYLPSLGVEWGTDSNAFSEIAIEYFENDFPDFIPNEPDEDGDSSNNDETESENKKNCQLNYIIVIGDGVMSNTGFAYHKNTVTTTLKDKGYGFTAQRLETLRKKGVKTLFVAYGTGLREKGLAYMDALARVGSCKNEGDPDCEPTIQAATPQTLKTALQSKLRQIIASKLSFTAPSITATIQEGGSLYQAQFEYQQYGEWQGTILKKKLKADGTVVNMDDEEASESNWDAAKEIRKQAVLDTRKIWTILEDKDYADAGWNNWTVDNEADIDKLFKKLGFELKDYHTSTSHCGKKKQLENGVHPYAGLTDELRGLINFVRGKDYFNYKGDCKLDKVRPHILGDIYHSQLIEIGPPDGSIEFTDTNQEAYYRASNNYQAFMYEHRNRKNIIYAGSNSGVLHAIDADTGQEEWAFVPPFIAAKLPMIINKDYDQLLLGESGGSNPIFGVDGSPVVHDVFIRGLDPRTGILEPDPSWHTVLFVPYGRGGSGFSVIDVTEPIISDVGPRHMFSVYNDYVNSIVYITNSTGETREEAYSQNTASIAMSLEGQRARVNLNQAKTDDGYPNETDTTNQDTKAPCQTNEDMKNLTSQANPKFYTFGTNTCFKGQTFTFDEISFDIAAGKEIPKHQLNVSQYVDGELKRVSFTSAKMNSEGLFEITFPTSKAFNPGASELEQTLTDNFFIQSSCTSTTGIPKEYDYSKLGETWSTPRIVRLPSDDPAKQNNSIHDKYVAIMGAGYGNNNLCAGSALYMINLDMNPDDAEGTDPAIIYGAEQNNGPLLIVDTTNEGVSGTDGNDVDTPTGSDITNAVPTNPIVITADTTFGIPWRGAMVYLNDREGKITKINLTDQEGDSDISEIEMFDQTTLFRLDANTDNKRYTFFSMDAGIGYHTRDLWLWGGTGDFSALGDRSAMMDNILFGVRDEHFPKFKHLNGQVIPPRQDKGTNSASFVEAAHKGANYAPSIENTASLLGNDPSKPGTFGIICEDVTGSTDINDCPDGGAWYVKLDQQDGKIPNDPTTVNTFRKLSAPPTLFKGQVYFPVYEPAPGSNPCNIGNAYICVTDDECGMNNSHLLGKGSAANGAACHYVRPGVLSELVIFGENLYANVAGPSEDEDTLYKVLSAPGEVMSNRGNWRDSGF